jgi:hypothetical protein
MALPKRRTANAACAKHLIARSSPPTRRSFRDTHSRSFDTSPAFKRWLHGYNDTTRRADARGTATASGPL